jgi:hypothetical protein
MEAIATLVKAFEGDVYGSYIRKRMRNEACTCLEARINPESYHAFCNVLSITHDIHSVVRNTSHNILTVKPVQTRDDTSNFWWVIVLMLETNMTFALRHVDFDVNSLVQTCMSTFVRPVVTLYGIPYFDKFDLVSNRIKEKRFAILFQPSTFQETATNMIEAVDMVKDGWKMDDIYARKSSWIINTWKSMVDLEDVVRCFSSSEERIKTIEHNVCSLCHENFKDDDVVVNTCCNHNFHWKCDPMKLEGILYWFQLKQDFTCPFCRSPAVRLPGCDATDTGIDNTSVTVQRWVVPSPPPPPPPPPNPHANTSSIRPSTRRNLYRQ